MLDQFVEWRGEFLMSLAIGIGRLAEKLHTWSTALHRSAMADYAHGMADDDREGDR